MVKAGWTCMEQTSGRGHAARIRGLFPVRQRSPKAADPTSPKFQSPSREIPLFSGGLFDFGGVFYWVRSFRVGLRAG